MTEDTEQAETWSPAELAFRKAMHEAIKQADADGVILGDVLTSMSELVARLLMSLEDVNVRLGSCSIFHCQMVDWINTLSEGHDPDTCPDCIAAGRGEGRTVQ